MLDSSPNYTRSSNADSQQRGALERVNRALRSVLESSIELHADSQTLNQLAEQIEALDSQLDVHRKHRLLEYFDFSALRDGGNGCQPYSPIGGACNPILPELTYHTNGSEVQLRGVFSLPHEGPPQSLHGGLVASVFDQIMGTVCAHNKFGAPTAQLNISYKDYTPLHKELVFSAKIERVEGVKIYVSAQCHCEGKLTAEADALFINKL